MPVPTVMKRGMPTVSSGSQMTDLRQHFRMEDNLLGVGGLVGDNTGAANFRGGSSRRRYGDNRRDPGRIGAGPPVTDILKIPDRPRSART